MSTWDGETDLGTAPGGSTAAGTSTGSDTGGRHPVDVGHLVMGLAFAGLVVLWGLITQDLVTRDDLRWLLPLPWVLAGGAGLVAMTVGSRRRARAAEPYAGS